MSSLSEIAATPGANALLRAHVLRVGFDLSLGKTHVATLVQLDEMLRRNDHMHLEGGRNAFSMFVPGVRGLQDRGLVEYTSPDPIRYVKGKRVETPVRRIWKLTRAGKLVIGLLKESGVYQDYATNLQRLEKRRERSA